MEHITKQLLNRLRTDRFITAAELAAAVGVSERTVRSRLKGLASCLKRHGAQLTAKPRLGYCLTITDEERYASWKGQDHGGQAPLPGAYGDRILFLLAYFLNLPGYVKLDDLAELLYVSRNTLTADLKRVECVLETYHLAFHRRPNYGIRIQGREFDQRLCMADCLMKQDVMGFKTAGQEIKRKAVAEAVREVLRERRLEMGETDFESLVLSVCVAIERQQGGHKIETADELKESVGEGAFGTARLLGERLREYCGWPWPEEELFYLAIHISGKSVPGAQRSYGSNLVISSQIDELALKMLAAVYESVRLDFRNDLELRMSLNQHMVPFDIRMRYEIPMKNPLLGQIKREYAFAYAVAAAACTVLNHYYNREVPEDEVGYFAVLFALAIEKQDRKISRKNIVVVCVSGRGSSQLFLRRYRQAFGPYIHKIYECTIYDLEGFDFRGKEIDYVFTTIPIHLSLPVPILEVSLLLGNEEVDSCRRLLEKGNNGFLERFFDSRLFLERLEAGTKEDALRRMCGHVSRYRRLPEGFFEAVWQREQLGQTDFGNLAAIPHPCRILPGKPFVAVAVLERPIWWGHNEVQLVLLIFLAEEADEDTERFYQAVTAFLADAKAVLRLIAKPEFGVLLEELQSAGQ